MSMEFWDLPGDSSQPEPQGAGFRDALEALSQRRFNELGAGWRLLPERLQRAEAGRRARREMARRVAQHTGKRPPSERTIARRARQDDPPPGVDKAWLDRWAAIDRAGGIGNLARQIGASEGQVRRWRDSPDPAVELPIGKRRGVPPIPVAGIVVRIRVKGFVVINGKEYPKDIPTNPDAEYDTITVDPGGELMQAFFDGDEDQLRELLGEEIAMQIIIPTWSNLPATYQVGYLVDEILLFQPEA